MQDGLRGVSRGTALWLRSFAQSQRNAFDAGEDRKCIPQFWVVPPPEELVDRMFHIASDRVALLSDSFDLVDRDLRCVDEFQDEHELCPR